MGIAMLQAILDQRLMRLMLGIGLGLPVSALALLGTLYGLAMGYGGIVSGKDLPLSAFILLVTLLALAGLAGAWRRILKPRATMTSAEARTVRALLGAGVVSSSCLAAGTVLWVGSHAFAGVFVFIGAMGVVLLLATPGSPAAGSAGPT